MLVPRTWAGSTTPLGEVDETHPLASSPHWQGWRIGPAAPTRKPRVRHPPPVQVMRCKMISRARERVNLTLWDTFKGGGEAEVSYYKMNFEAGRGWADTPGRIPSARLVNHGGRSHEVWMQPLLINRWGGGHMSLRQAHGEANFSYVLWPPCILGWNFPKLCTQESELRHAVTNLESGLNERYSIISSTKWQVFWEWFVKWRV